MLSFERVNGGDMIPALRLYKRDINKVKNATFKNWNLEILMKELVLYIRMFKGRSFEMYWDAKSLTDACELKSNSITSILAFGIFSQMLALTFWPSSTFLTGITTWTPRKARTRAVSKPIPLDAPKYSQICCKISDITEGIGGFIYIIRVLLC